MQKEFIFSVIAIFLSIAVKAQGNVHFVFPDQLRIEFRSAKHTKGYYHNTNDQFVVDLELKDSITRFLYDGSFNAVKQYSIHAQTKRLLPDKKLEVFVKNLCIQDQFLEVYASDDSISIYKLDFEKSGDIKIAGIALRKKYDDEVLVAVMPNNHGSNFLTVSLDKKKAAIYKWRSPDAEMTSMEIDLPKSTLSKEETRERGDFLKVKYKNLFSAISVSDINNPTVFQFPSPSQLFFNDSCIYIINKTPYQAGINVFKINSNTGYVNSTNYFLNKVESETQAQYLTCPVATMYNNLLIIQNCSPKKFEYYFFDVITGTLLKKYETKPDNSLYDLVHSQLRQIGTFGSGSGEKALDNEKLFIKRRNIGLMFLKPVISKDSLILTFGSLVPTQGIEGTALGMVSVGLGSFMAPVLGEAGSLFFPYFTTWRNKFLYAHSKFSLDGLQPSKTNGIKTYLDDVVEDGKLKTLDDNNSICIELPGKLYIAIYDKKNKRFDVSHYQ